MRIIYKDSFVNRLENQIEYIAQDKPLAARKFKKELFNSIKSIPKNPFRFRKSIYFNDNNIRDLIYKGYTIVFRINNDIVEVFGFVKSQKYPTD